jgi:hypothetical protein
MQYGMPRNFRAPRAREDNKQSARGFKRHPKGKKKFGLELTMCQHSWMWGTNRRNQWYATAKGRDEAYKRLKNQRQWFYPDRFYYLTVQKIER